MERLEVHLLTCSKDVFWCIKTLKLFKFHSKLDFDIVIHDDGTLDDYHINYLKNSLGDITVIKRDRADEEIREFLKDYELCSHFRLSKHHTIYRIKLFDQFYFTKSHNVIYMDSDILFCDYPEQVINCINDGVGFYLKDKWTSYCMPFYNDSYTDVDRFICAGFDYYPTKEHFSLNHIEDSLKILYEHGARNASHPFLEQSCTAYMISQLKKDGKSFIGLDDSKYCVPTLGGFIPEHGYTVLHLNSCPIVGPWKVDHYNHEMIKVNLH